MTRRSSPRLLAPEVVQTSAMDCGPASLKCLLEGFGIPVSYGRLREACQTDVDGTSIDTIEEVARQLGLDAEQVMIPVDHVLLREAKAVPAIAVVVQPNGSTHFVVVWRRVGHLVQVMDPSTGRHWLAARSLLNGLYVHTMTVLAAGWLEWARSEDSLDPLRGRMKALGFSPDRAEELIARACDDPSWHSLAALDAAARMVSSVVRSRGLRRGHEAAGLVEALVAGAGTAGGRQAIPDTYWSVRPGPPDRNGEEQVLLRGAVLVRVRGRTTRAEEAGGSEEQARLPRELIAALTEAKSRPGRDLLALLRQDGLLAATTLAAVMLLSGGTVVIEALLLRCFVDLSRELMPGAQRLAAILAVLSFLVLVLGLEMPLASAAWRFGRGLELRLRAAFLAKIPRLGDRYFQSRLTSDMAYRSHSVHTLRMLPGLGGRLLRALGEIFWTSAGIVWLDPASAPLVIAAVATCVGLPLLAQPILAERDLKLRNHAGALSRFYLDGLLGLVAIRTHRAARAVQREHENLLVEWVRAGLGLQRAAVAMEGIAAAFGLGLTALLVMLHVARSGESSAVLLLSYWALRLPALGDTIALLARQYPARRSTTLRLLEPLGALDEEVSTTAVGEDDARPTPAGVGIAIDGVMVRAAGHTILEGIDVAIPAGSHVAIVGPSGAGKSSLVGLLLGWHRPTVGRVLADGEVLDGSGVARLRRDTAWLDPAVQLWNRSLLDNLRYGVADEPDLPVGAALEKAELFALLEQLPDGLQTSLGEGGALVSGGEGQRVRLARALLRPGVRLAILDEPFRGLDRSLRRVLLSRARTHWREATLLCVTHDVEETLSFDRVLVIADGRVVEDGDPALLSTQETSRYRGMLDAERRVRSGLWENASWRRVRLADGGLHETTPDRMEGS